MTAFVPSFSLTALRQPTIDSTCSFHGARVCVSRTSAVPTRSHAPAQIVCEEPAEFNYNIYQDSEDRSKRQLTDSDRAVVVEKPMGMVLEEGQDGMVFIAEMDPEGNAADTGEVNEGDVLVAVSATFGEEVWSTRGVGLDRVMKSIRIRAGDYVTLVLESPAQLSERKTAAARLAAFRRTEARDKFGEREVLDPVSWTPVGKPAALYEDGDPEQAKINDELKEKLKREIVAPYEQNWILWIGGFIFVLVILSVAFGIN